MVIRLTIGAVATATAFGVVACGATAPHSQLFGRTLVKGTNDRQPALTFDDGPNGSQTLQLKCFPNLL